jgi:uncharacterized protein (DUF58 family)
VAVILLNIFTIYSFKYSQILANDKCEKGETTELNIELMNESIIPLSLLAVTVEVVSPKDKQELILNLEPFSGKKFIIPVTLPYRGFFKIGMTKIQINDIFGLVPFRFDMRSLFFYRMKPLIVLPRARVPSTVSVAMTDTKSNDELNYMPANQGDSISGARPYIPGDAAKRIHWKKSIQQSELYVKQYDHPAREQIAILLDSSAQKLSGEALLRYSDTVCECAASISLHTILRGRDVQLLSSGNPESPFQCTGMDTFEHLRRILALLEFDKTADLENAFQHFLRSAAEARELFVITRNLTPALNILLEKAQNTHRSVTMVVVGEATEASNIHTIYVEEGANASASIASSIV